MYSQQDKKDFILKDVKYAIGQGLGNAFSKAVDMFIALKENYKLEIEKEDWNTIENIIFQWRDNFFASNQLKAAKEYSEWLKENEDGLDMTLGLGVKDNPEPL